MKPFLRKYLASIVCAATALAVYAVVYRQVEILRTDESYIKKIEEFSASDPQRAANCGAEHTLNAWQHQNAAIDNFQNLVGGLNLLLVFGGVLLFIYERSRKTS